MKREYKHTFYGIGQSDDCGSLTGAYHENGDEVDEYDAVHNWFELKLDGEVIGRCMMNYDRGWEFIFKSDTHKMEAGKLLCMWNGEPLDREDDADVE